MTNYDFEGRLWVGLLCLIRPCSKALYPGHDKYGVGPKSFLAFITIRNGMAVLWEAQL
jgi:hypothetical protein